MKIQDLTHTIKGKMTLYPGTANPKIEQIASMEKNLYREHKIEITSHTGTHIDAPAHMKPLGKTLDQMDISQFIGRAYCIDVSDIKGQTIELEYIKKYKDKIEICDFLILKTNNYKAWNTDEYFNDYKTLSIDGAKWLTKMNLKGIGVDAISVDTMDTESFEIHYEILATDSMIIIENLNNLAHLPDFFNLSVMPMKFENSDGSPVRAIATWEE